MTAKDVPPGGVGEVKATFESKGYHGEVKKTITVESNDTENPTVRLTLQGTVVADVTVTPQAVNLGYVKAGEPAKPVPLTILLTEGKGIKVTEVSSDSKMILLKKQKETEKEVVYEVSLAGKVPIGKIFGQIEVTTNNKKSPKVIVPFRATIQGNVKVTPQIVSFGTVPPGKTVTQTLYVEQDGDKEFTIKQVKTTSTQITAEIIPIKEKSQYEVKLTFDPEDKKEGRISERISIFVNDPEENILEVPVYGAIRQQTMPMPRVNERR